MKKMFFIGCLLCLAAVCRAQYIGSDYLNMKFDYVVDESQMQGTVGYGKVFKCFKVGANLNLSLIHISEPTRLSRPGVRLLAPEGAQVLFSGRGFRHDWLPEGKDQERAGLSGA